MVLLKIKYYARFIGENTSISLLNGEIYAVVGEEDEGELWIVVDETDCDYLFDADCFERLKEEDVNDIQKKKAENRVRECNRKLATYGPGNY